MENETNNVRPEPDLDKAYAIRLPGCEAEVKLKYNTYANNGTLALQLDSRPSDEELEMMGLDIPKEEIPYDSPFATVTVNLPESEILPPDEQFVKENGQNGMGEWLQRNGIAEPSGMIAFSGYCSYMSYKFNIPQHIYENVVGERVKANERMREEQFRQRRPNVHIRIDTPSHKMK